MPAEVAGQRALLERAAAGDREAFARLYDGQVEGVYRYLLAWTGDRAEAADLTEQVFHGALAWLPVTAGGDGEAGAWLIAMARDAVAQRRGSGWIAGPDPAPDPSGPARDAVAAVALLGDPEREVVILRLLLGHSLAHTAHLSGYSRRAVLELQLAACQAVRDLTGGAHGGTAAPTGASSADEFERCLGRWAVDPTGTDPALADTLAAASSLRAAGGGYLVAPDDAFVQRLRRDLLANNPPLPHLTHPGSHLTHPGSRLTHPVPGRVPRWGSVAQPGGSGVGLSTGLRELTLLRRPWLATAIATTGIVVVLALQAFANPTPPSACGGRPCPPPTTLRAAAAGEGVGVPLTTIREPTTTSSVPRTLAPPAAPQTAAAAAAPATTRPVTSAPQTSRQPGPTTTGAPAPTTTLAPTSAPTTTAAAAASTTTTT